MGGFPRGEISDSFGAGDSRHAISGEIAGRLFGGRASHARSPVEGRQPEPSSSVAGCGSRWNFHNWNENYFSAFPRNVSDFGSTPMRLSVLALAVTTILATGTIAAADD